MSIRACTITFPGSNCDQDMHRAIRLMGWDLVKLWHNNQLDEPCDVIFVPGGFSYGDYLRCGALAKFSLAMESVREQVRRGGLVVGVCNGFQILCEAGLLPGALTRNSGLKFRCLWSHLVAESRETAFACRIPPGQVLRIPIAHGEGNYVVDGDGLRSLEDHGQIAFRYCTGDGMISPVANPNGSTHGIAGVMSRDGRVLGMMPHPERAMEPALGGTDGRMIFESIEASLARAGA